MENNNLTDNNFFCYSCRLFHFLKSFDEKCYISKINKKSNTRYWVFHKSERLDNLINLYNSIKEKY